jgi:hypothetical protein
MGGREGALRPILCVNEPQKMGERANGRVARTKQTSCIDTVVTVLHM